MAHTSLVLLAVSTGKKVSGAAAQKTVSYPDNLTYRGELGLSEARL